MQETVCKKSAHACNCKTHPKKTICMCHFFAARNVEVLVQSRTKQIQLEATPNVECPNGCGQHISTPDNNFNFPSCQRFVQTTSVFFAAQNIYTKKSDQNHLESQKITAIVGSKVDLHNHRKHDAEVTFLVQAIKAHSVQTSHFLLVLESLSENPVFVYEFVITLL